jgi:FkbM family methyltransferase
VKLGPRPSSQVAALRQRLAETAIRRGGWPLPAKAIEGLRDMSLYALGAGSPSLGPAKSGESDLLRRLALQWSARRRVTVVDVGAYAGHYAVAARSAFGDAAVIHCFEPNPLMFASLSARLAGEAGTTCHQLALSRARGTAGLFSDGPSSPRASLERDTFGITGREIEQTHVVSTTTLSHLASEHALTHIDVLKLDVGGHELAVLDGAAELLARKAVEVVQFEFGERSLASRTFLRDFHERLGSTHRFFRVTPRGPVEFDYRPKHEVFALETNYAAVAADTSGPIV